MNKYIKLFETTAAYDAAKDNLDLPNVSYCEDNNEVHYKPWVAKIVATVNVTSTSSATTILNETDYFSAVEIDGVEQQSVGRKYTFSTTGEHTVKYTLKEPTSIGESAFEDCSSLTSITIPNSVTNISIFAFSGCSGLTSVTIGSGVTSISNSAFYGCTGLTSIVVDSANTVLDSRDNCNAIINTSTNELIRGCKNTVIPNTVTSIGNSAFDGSGLTSIIIPDSVTSIGVGAFSDCSGLTNITIPDSVTSIGNNAFSYCTGLTSLTIGSGVTSIGNSAFDGSGLTSITSNATTAPTIQSETFISVKTGGTLYVPSGSTGYDVWMSTGGYYLGKYNWTKVEQ